MSDINFDLKGRCHNKTYEIKQINDELKSDLLPEINHLVLVANPNESNVLFNYLRPVNTICGNKFNDKILLYESNTTQQYYIAKLFNTTVVALILSEMGSIKTNAAILAMTEAINLFQPKFATIIGICASLNSNVNIGDVIIANPIISYDSKKEKNNTTIYRGQRFYPYQLINRFDHKVLSSFKKFKVFKGELVSGETLSDSAEFKSELKAAFPETLGLDMEGIGFATVCVKFNVQWIFIKGVSDDGEHKSDAYQKLAADNALKVSEILFNSSLNKELLKPIPTKNRSVFISGAIHSYDGTTTHLSECPFARQLTKSLLEKNYRIISGLGKGIGDEILRATYEYTGKLKQQFVNQDSLVSEYLMTIPFPYNSVWHKKNDKITNQYVENQRCGLIKSCRVAIFIFGNKLAKEGIVLSTGMIKEFDIAKKENCLLVPIGATGLQSRILWEEIENNFGEYYKEFLTNENRTELNKLFHILNMSINLQDLEECEKLTDIVLKFIECASNH